MRREGSQVPSTTSIEEIGKAEKPSILWHVGIILLTALVAFSVVFSPMRLWMQQRTQAQELAQKVASAEERNQGLKDQLARWDDPDFVAAEARDRLGYVRPGEKTYVVVDSPEVQPVSVTPGDTAVEAELPWFLTIANGVVQEGVDKQK